MFDLHTIKWKKVTAKDSFKYLKEYERSYIPDFYLPEYDIYLEVKGVWFEDTKDKMKLVEQYNDISNLSVIDKDDYPLILKKDFDEIIEIIKDNRNKRPWCE